MVMIRGNNSVKTSGREWEMFKDFKLDMYTLEKDTHTH